MCDSKSFTVAAFPKPLRPRLTSLDVPAKSYKKQVKPISLLGNLPMILDYLLVENRLI